MQIIYTTDELRELCSRLKTQDFVAVDFEFVREKSYYSIPCLIQVANEEEAALIDPLAPDIDLTPFWEIMKNPDITKVFHSCRQEVEIIYNMTGSIPLPLFDTQLVAMVCGFGESVGYEKLVKSILKISIDKSECLSNWQMRPLNEKQLEYACGDVTHLVKIYKYLKRKVERNKRMEWLQEEMDILCDPKTYYVEPSEAWLRIKLRTHNNKVLSRLKALCEWRELRAQKRNTPRQSLIKDDVLVTIAIANPQTLQDLENIRGIRKEQTVGKFAEEILETVANAKIYRNMKRPGEEIIKASPSLVEMLKMLLRIISQKNAAVPRIIAHETDLQHFAAKEDDKTNFLTGWRFEVFGKHALKLRNGKLSIRYNPETKGVDFVELD